MQTCGSQVTDLGLVKFLSGKFKDAHMHVIEGNHTSFTVFLGFVMHLHMNALKRDKSTFIIALMM